MFGCEIYFIDVVLFHPCLGSPSRFQFPRGNRTMEEEVSSVGKTSYVENNLSSKEVCYPPEETPFICEITAYTHRPQMILGIKKKKKIAFNIEKWISLLPYF